jgi:hypothetical protein
MAYHYFTYSNRTTTLFHEGHSYVNINTEDDDRLSFPIDSLRQHEQTARKLCFSREHSGYCWQNMEILKVKFRSALCSEFSLETLCLIILHQFVTVLPIIKDMCKKIRRYVRRRTFVVTENLLVLRDVK